MITTTQNKKIMKINKRIARSVNAVDTQTQINGRQWQHWIKWKEEKCDKDWIKR